MHETIEEKELHIAQQELLLLRSQIQPDFVFHSLSIIRSLAKSDKKASAAAIDSFSFYLRAHLNAIRDDAPISLNWELECVRAYLALVEAGDCKPMELVCELGVTEFHLPPLTLEPAVEYCIRRGLVSDGKVTICTSEDNAGILLRVSVSGSDTQCTEEQNTELDNVRQRMELYCGGTLRTDTGAEETAVIITIPRHQAA